MECHLEKRRDTAIWRRHRISVEDVLKSTNLLNEEDLKDEVVQKICGILDVNAFEVSTLFLVCTGRSRIMLPVFSMIN